jgi:hypothetical protein
VIIIGIFVFLFFVLVISSIGYKCDPISSIELDETTHWQMRKQGWTEEEIEEFMGDCYDENKQRGEK